MDKFVSASENETKKIAYKLASTLKTGDVIVLSGDLGAGKTLFAKGLLSFWELENEVSSPTFTIVNEYSAATIPSPTHIYHFDVYRLSGSEEFCAIGGPEYFENGISIIEWGEIIESILPQNHIKITFEKDLADDTTRHITISNM